MSVNIAVAPISFQSYIDPVLVMRRTTKILEVVVKVAMPGLDVIRYEMLERCHRSTRVENVSAIRHGQRTIYRRSLASDTFRIALL